MNEGWIKLHRQIQDNTIWTSEPFSRGQAWVDLLLLANHKRGVLYIRGNKVEVERGQVGWSQKKLSERWKWSRGKVQRFLNDLENEHQIEQQKNTVTSLIAITNYEEFQNTDSKRTSDGHQTDTNKNKKKKKNENKVYSFSEFWDAYGKKTDRHRCELKFSKLTDKELAQIKDHVPKYVRDHPEVKYRKNPLTYLNGKVWLDEDCSSNGLAPIRVPNQKFV